MTGYTPDTLLEAKMTPMDPEVAAVDTHVQISIRIKNPLRYATQIQFYIPRWNPDEADMALHMILDPRPRCSPLVGLSPLIKCEYNFTTQILTLSRPVE